ncbi:MAG: hypothetical protein CL736_07530 [Chloroflexi bacterium]|nr:hypothetical protein [Chloroflexota bacterium]
MGSNPTTPTNNIKVCTMSNNNITQLSLDYLSSMKFEDIPPEVVDRCKQLLLDFLGVTLGGAYLAESSQPIMNGIKKLVSGASGPSQVIGFPYKYPAHYAALANATLAHSMDFDDTHQESIIHPGTPIFSSNLALAQEYGKSGMDFLLASIIGYDITLKIGRTHGPLIHRKGFHATATTNIFGCTAAGGKLLNLSTDIIQNAMGLNISQIAGSQQFLENGSWNKRFHTGLTPHNSILSLVMAQHGYLGATEPIEGKFGYFNLYSEGEITNFSIFDSYGTDFEVMNTAVKPYPCCRFSHATIDAVLDITQSNSINYQDITNIDITMGKTGYDMVGYSSDYPKNTVEAQFSAYFAAAVAAMQGEYLWDSYKLIGDKTLEEMMSKVTVTQKTFNHEMESNISLTTVNGQRYEQNVEYPKGEPENPLGWTDTRQKFIGLAQPILGEEKSEAVYNFVYNLESRQSMSEINAFLIP